MFLVAHEMLMDAIIGRLHEFYSDSWSVEQGWTTGRKYEAEVKTLDPKAKGDPFRGSIVWLRKMDVIDAQDEATIRSLTNERNRFAHEMRHAVGGSVGVDFEKLFPQLVGLVAKIDTWWVVNFDAAVNPDFSEFDIDEEEVVPGSIILLRVLEAVALGKEDEAWALYEAFSNEPSGKTN